MSFFIKGKQTNGIKRAKYSTDKNKKRKTNFSKKNDEITSSEDEFDNLNDIPDATSSEDENETAQEKKLRLAKVYLEEIAKEEQARLENEEIDQTVISKRLKEDYLSQTGKLRLKIADKYTGYDESAIKLLKCREHRSSITCFCISSDDKYLYAGGKDCSVVKYSLTDHKKVATIPFVKTKPETGPIIGHSTKIKSIAISSDSRFLAVGDETGEIQIWNPANFKHIKTLKGHKSAVTGVCFQRETLNLYSCSKDRTAKVWNLAEMGYVETLFGHQDAIASIDSLYRDRVITCGGKDLRIWKIAEETQLIFNGHNGNIDNVKLINDENFLSAGDDGQICFWSIIRKKPLCCIEMAHGRDPKNNEPYWISAVAAHVNTDLVASGSQDGFVRVWKLENNFKSAKLLFKVAIEGFVNALAFTSDGSRLIVAAGKEPKFGRWSTIKSAKNGVFVVPLLSAS